MFQIIRQDLLNAPTAAICHQVNCRGVMGAGVAKAIAERFPEVKTEYEKLCRLRNSVQSQNELLGTVQRVDISGGSRAVFNIFGQLNYGRGVRHTDYDALTRAFVVLNRMCIGKSVAFPYGFGCGLGGGNWMQVETLMLKYLRDCDVYICMKED